MDLTPYVANLRHELAVAAATGDDEVAAIADRLATALDSAVRLTLFDALATAAQEITRELAPGSVDVRLRGREPEFVVTPPPAEAPAAEPEVAPPPADDGATARINLRLPDQLKSQVERAAGREGLSVNGWLVRAVAAAVQPGSPRRKNPAGDHYTGWVR